MARVLLSLKLDGETGAHRGTLSAHWLLREEFRSDSAHSSEGALFFTRLFPTTGCSRNVEQKQTIGTSKYIPFSESTE